MKKTVILSAIITGMAMSASASLVIKASGSAVNEAGFNGLSVNAGDVVVAVHANNGNLAGVTDSLSNSWSNVQIDAGGAAQVSYTTIGTATNAYNIDFGISSSTARAYYILYADGAGESVALIDSNTGSTTADDFNAGLTFDSTDGLAIMAVDTGSPLSTIGTGWNAVKYQNNRRLIFDQSFTAKTGTDLNTTFSGTGDAHVYASAVFAAVPEPATIGMLGMGSLAVLFVRRKFMI